jgi:hypothetical protein
MHTKLSERIINARHIMGGPPSNHDSIVLHLQFKRKKGDNTELRSKKTRISWNKLNDPKNAAEFKEIALENLRQLTIDSLPTAKVFSKVIVKAAKSTCVEDDPDKSGWFADNAHSIIELLVEEPNAASELL